MVKVLDATEFILTKFIVNGKKNVFGTETKFTQSICIR